MTVTAPPASTSAPVKLPEDGFLTSPLTEPESPTGKFPVTLTFPEFGTPATCTYHRVRIFPFAEASVKSMAHTIGKAESAVAAVALSVLPNAIFSNAPLRTDTLNFAEFILSFAKSGFPAE